MTAEIIPFRHLSAPPDAPKPGSIRQQNGFSSATEQWLAAHPRFSTELAYNHAAMFGHYHALRCGLTADTAEYFEHVEFFTGDRELPAASCRPMDQIECDGQKWIVWDVSAQMQPIVVVNGRKTQLVAGTWTKLGDAVKRALEMVKP